MLAAPLPLRRLLCLALALALVGLGQALLATRPAADVAAGVALLWGGAVPLAWLSGGGSALTASVPAVRPLPPRWWALMLVLPTAVLAWLGAADNQFRAWGAIFWLGAVALWLVGWRVEQRPTLPEREREPLRRWQLLAFVAILLVAGWFRFWQLPTLPAEMTSDHAEKLLDVLDVLEGQPRIFFPRNTGREPMQFYVTALLAGPLGFGVSHLALKVGTALVGWLTVPLCYAMARHGLGWPRGAALLAMALLASSKWHVAISRVGLRFPYAPFGVALTLLFLLRAVRLGARRDWLLAGAAFGVALYGYTPVRILPLLLGAGALLWLALEQARGRTGLPWRTALLNVALCPLTTLLLFLPLLRFSLENPALFWYRSSSRAVAGAEGSLLSLFVGNVRNALLMFHVRGDQVWVNMLPGDPVLDRWSGALLVVGAALLGGALLRRWRAAEATLFAAFPLLLLPSILALAWPEENPSVVRAGGALPVVMLLAALPLWLLLNGAWPRGATRGARLGQRLLAGSTLALLALVLTLNARLYFGPYAAQYDEMSWNASEVAAAILQHEGEIGGVAHAYVITWPHWIDTRNVAINMGHPRWNGLLLDVADVADPSALPAEPRLVVFPYEDRRDLNALRALWPDAIVETVPSRVPGKEFVVVRRGAGAEP